MNYWYVWQAGWISREWCWGKKTIPKVTYCMISFIQHSWNDKIIEIEKWLPGVKETVGGRELGVAKKRSCRDPGGEALYLHCINVNLLSVALYYSFAKHYHWGKLGKGYSGPLCIISYNCMWIYNYLRTKCLIFLKCPNLKNNIWSL